MGIQGGSQCEVLKCLALLKAEHSADSVQVLGPCEGVNGCWRGLCRGFQGVAGGKAGEQASLG